MHQHEKDTQNCLSIEDNKAALDCLKEVVAQYANSDICRPKLVLLVQDRCIPCKEEAALHADDIARGIIQTVNINSPEGLAIAKKNNLDSVPSLLLLDCNDNLIEPV